MYADQYILIVGEDISISYPWVYIDGQPYYGTVSLQSTGKKIGELHPRRPVLPHGPDFLRGYIKALCHYNRKRGTDSGEYWYADSGDASTK